MTEQPRTPSGNPDGGQFATTPRSDDVDELDVDAVGELSDEEYNAEATYFWPNPPRSLQQMVDFWKRVEVPSKVLDDLSLTYFNTMKQERQQIRDQHEKEWVAEWERDNPRAKGEPGAGPNNPDRQRARDNWMQQKTMEMHRSMMPEGAPEDIHPSDIRSVARAHKAAWAAVTHWGKDSPECLRLADEVTWPTSRGRETTRAIQERYQTTRFRNTFFDTQAEDSASEKQENEETQELLRNIEQRLQAVAQNSEAQKKLAAEQAALLEQIQGRMRR